MENSMYIILIGLLCIILIAVIIALVIYIKKLHEVIETSETVLNKIKCSYRNPDLSSICHSLINEYENNTSLYWKNWNCNHLHNSL